MGSWSTTVDDMKNKPEFCFGSSRLRCNFAPISGTLRIEPDGVPVWECRLFSDLHAGLVPEDLKWPYPLPQPFAWAPGKNEIGAITSRGDLNATFPVKTPAGDVVLSVEVDPNKPALRFIVEAETGAPAPLAFPGPLRPTDGIREESLYLPYCQGFVFAPRAEEICEPLAFQVCCGPGLGLPMVGLTCGGNGWLLVFETADDAAVEVAKPSAGPIEVRPIWLSSGGKIGYRRALRFEFFQQANGAKLAKRYRAFVRNGPTWKTLGEKAKEVTTQQASRGGMPAEVKGA
ncbi:MAG: hypothetical protein QME60_07635, partial [Verrucomicrobiota bacterium]|nr:hypothetical protein [Verrucomicrobiota bacterium]